ncbi:hsp90 co-chaperone Cdc37-like isoform X2 [Stigmatopora argus]
MSGTGTGTGTGIDYSTWDHIDVSDDDDVTSPYVDTPSLFRMRHRVRLEKMAAFQQRGEDLQSNLSECGKLLEEAQERLQVMEGRSRGDEAELIEVRAQVDRMRRDKKQFEKMLEEHKHEEKRLPWNVDTISKEGFSKSIVNMKAEDAPQEKPAEDENFVEKYAKEIRHFGMLRRYDDSQKYLSDNPHLVCEETANRLVAICIDFELDEKHGLMEQVAHQAIVMQSILNLGRALKADPRGCFRHFFSTMKSADRSDRDALERELESLKERVRSCARMRMEEAREELEEEEEEEEEEEKFQRLGPGGLDPFQVYESLPKDMQRSFQEKNAEMLREAVAKLHPDEGKYHLARCIDSGLWVPEPGEDEDDL